MPAIVQSYSFYLVLLTDGLKQICHPHFWWDVLVAWINHMNISFYDNANYVDMPENNHDQVCAV